MAWSRQQLVLRRMRPLLKYVEPVEYDSIVWPALRDSTVQEQPAYARRATLITAIWPRLRARVSLMRRDQATTDELLDFIRQASVEYYLQNKQSLDSTAWGIAFLVDPHKFRSIAPPLPQPIPVAVRDGLELARRLKQLQCTTEPCETATSLLMMHPQIHSLTRAEQKRDHIGLQLLLAESSFDPADRARAPEIRKQLCAAVDEVQSSQNLRPRPTRKR
jgi:hypothetical protein